MIKKIVYIQTCWLQKKEVFVNIKTLNAIIKEEKLKDDKAGVLRIKKKNDI